MPILGERHIRRNKPNRVYTEDGWVDLEEAPVCDVCGFEAKSLAGLGRHRGNQHDDGEEE